jgi:hypothetical protein
LCLHFGACFTVALGVGGCQRRCTGKPGLEVHLADAPHAPTHPLLQQGAAGQGRALTAAAHSAPPYSTRLQLSPAAVRLRRTLST